MTNTETNDLDEAFEDVTRLFEDQPVTFTGRTHTINVALANKVLDYIETNPEDHYQEAWATLLDGDFGSTVELESIDQAKTMSLGACGTAGCFAGWAAVLDGNTVGTIGDLAGVLIEKSIELGMEAELDDDGELIISGPRVQSEEYARTALGLTYDQAMDLFHGLNSRDRIRQLLSDWTDGEIARYSTAA